MSIEKNAISYPSIRAQSVVESVKDWITEQIINGNFQPGTKLPTETELCANLGASRNSVREAIKQLEAYGVVYIKRAEGTFITDHFEPRMMSPVLYSILFQQSSWEDFVSLRRAIDIGTLYVLMGKTLTEEKLGILQESLNALESAVREPSPDVKKITEADCAFHNTLLSLTGNPQIMTLSDYINRITIPSREETTEKVIRSGEIKSYADLHRQIYDIIAASDKSAIERTVLDHYVFWEKKQK